MEEYFGIKEIVGQPIKSDNVVRKRKRKITLLGFLALSTTALTFAAYLLLALRLYFDL